MGIPLGGVDRPWRWIGWGGIGFQVPVHWHLGRIGRRHLFFNDDNTPVLEIKWALPGKNHTADKLVSRLVGQPGWNVTMCPLPPHWSKAVAGQPAAGFAWSVGPAQGRGLALRCAANGTWILLQFPGPEPRPESEILLASLHDGCDNSGVRWSLFDVCAHLSPAFGLKKWNFTAGAYRLDFGARGGTLTLHRLAPADVILRIQSLARLAAGLADGCALYPEDAHQWRLVRKGPAGWLDRVQGREGRLRLWHLADANRIFAVAMNGSRACLAQMDRICEAYHYVGG